MDIKEKGRLEGSPIPNCVFGDTTESKASLLNLQASRLARRCAITAAMAATLAPLVFGEGGAA
ncbi:hypothetical protein [Bradyrhizobium sp. AUGA SZCCT0431]|uniref:hypothetical protein n=1 Tax=Bradyrhizobium sp. AUGA SZCCT0431 TaxID=2807674 RepID=UPI001BACEEEC|nr:hypothetical protein [Bradyrhizobium sp. AUGA SZCCT0431]MBR1145089.1 hypothetical protein [Bradyrhizobium sp. AUGA SZCCT0431]